MIKGYMGNNMDFEGLITKDNQYIYKELSEFAISLGYKKIQAKTKDLVFIFLHPQTRERVLKFSYSQKAGFSTHLKYDQTKSYSNFFHEAIRRTIEESNYKYTGCYLNCHKCDGTRGYIYTYKDQRKYFRCYQELIELFDLTKNELTEIKTMLKNQLV